MMFSSMNYWATPGPYVPPSYEMFPPVVLAPAQYQGIPFRDGSGNWIVPYGSMPTNMLGAAPSTQVPWPPMYLNPLPPSPRTDPQGFSQVPMTDNLMLQHDYEEEAYYDDDDLNSGDYYSENQDPYEDHHSIGYDQLPSSASNTGLCSDVDSVHPPFYTNMRHSTKAPACTGLQLPERKVLKIVDPRTTIQMPQSIKAVPNKAASSNHSISVQPLQLSLSNTRTMEEQLMSKSMLERLTRLAPVWIVVLKYSGIDSSQTVLTSQELLSKHQQHQLQVQTLIVGINCSQSSEGSMMSDLSKNMPVSAAFFRPLQYLLTLLATNSGYTPVTEAQLEAGLPPPDWCIPEPIFGAKKHADQLRLSHDGGTSSNCASQSVVAQFSSLVRKYSAEADSAASTPRSSYSGSGAKGTTFFETLELLTAIPFWCPVQSYDSAGGWRQGNCLSSEEALLQLRAGKLCSLTPILGSTTAIHRRVWIPTALVLPLGALAFLHAHSGRSIVGLSMRDMEYINHHGYRAVQWEGPEASEKERLKKCTAKSLPGQVSGQQQQPRLADGKGSDKQPLNCNTNQDTKSSSLRASVKPFVPSITVLSPPPQEPLETVSRSNQPTGNSNTGNTAATPSILQAALAAKPFTPAGYSFTSNSSRAPETLSCDHTVSSVTSLEAAVAAKPFVPSSISAPAEITASISSTSISSTSIRSSKISSLGSLKEVVSAPPFIPSSLSTTESTPPVSTSIATVTSLKEAISAKSFALPSLSTPSLSTPVESTATGSGKSSSLTSLKANVAAKPFVPATSLYSSEHTPTTGGNPPGSTSLSSSEHTPTTGGNPPGSTSLYSSEHTPTTGGNPPGSTSLYSSEHTPTTGGNPPASLDSLQEAVSAKPFVPSSQSKTADTLHQIDHTTPTTSADSLHHTDHCNIMSSTASASAEYHQPAAAPASQDLQLITATESATESATSATSSLTDQSSLSEEDAVPSAGQQTLKLSSSTSSSTPPSLQACRTSLTANVVQGKPSLAANVVQGKPTSSPDLSDECAVESAHSNQPYGVAQLAQPTEPDAALASSEEVVLSCTQRARDLDSSQQGASGSFWASTHIKESDLTAETGTEILNATCNQEPLLTQPLTTSEITAAVTPAVPTEAPLSFSTTASATKVPGSASAATSGVVPAAATKAAVPAAATSAVVPAAATAPGIISSPVKDLASPDLQADHVAAEITASSSILIDTATSAATATATTATAATAEVPRVVAAVSSGSSIASHTTERADERDMSPVPQAMPSSVPVRPAPQPHTAEVLAPTAPRQQMAASTVLPLKDVTSIWSKKPFSEVVKMATSNSSLATTSSASDKTPAAAAATKVAHVSSASPMPVSSSSSAHVSSASPMPVSSSPSAHVSSASPMPVSTSPSAHVSSASPMPVSSSSSAHVSSASPMPVSSSSSAHVSSASPMPVSSSSSAHVSSASPMPVSSSSSAWASPSEVTEGAASGFASVKSRSYEAHMVPLVDPPPTADTPAPDTPAHSSDSHYNSFNFRTLFVGPGSCYAHLEVWWLLKEDGEEGPRGPFSGEQMYAALLGGLLSENDRVLGTVPEAVDKKHPPSNQLISRTVKNVLDAWQGGKQYNFMTLEFLQLMQKKKTQQTSEPSIGEQATAQQQALRVAIPSVQQQQQQQQLLPARDAGQESRQQPLQYPGHSLQLENGVQKLPHQLGGDGSSSREAGSGNDNNVDGFKTVGKALKQRQTSWAAVAGASSSNSSVPLKSGINGIQSNISSGMSKKSNAAPEAVFPKVGSTSSLAVAIGTAVAPRMTGSAGSRGIPLHSRAASVGKRMGIQGPARQQESSQQAVKEAGPLLLPNTLQQRAPGSTTGSVPGNGSKVPAARVQVGSQSGKRTLGVGTKKKAYQMAEGSSIGGEDGNFGIDSGNVQGMVYDF
ncbi:hypothetical protein CEUSTIGMA_g4132.t1 [Chlamydomonas eustigma]|uniref:Uncharacterized protein n=1 Tax=Chlamydomonas eustigma TaxID=1157962 RepID=A0A250X0V7_9CHLO|nr:hypothetical protein CEUSTIGMA_g4132.t1 [Chlamydomonas eustigma]|eukprot:GAX76686.1 hypothetical protein CEUSTIGMA_g4132.t1 [Chlamydomonas eustigma]